MRRRFLLFLAAVAAVLLLGAVAVPLWLGLALRWGGESRGLKFARYERIGYGRFALHDAEVNVANVRVTVSRIELDTPLVLWWRKGEAKAGKWSVEVTPRTTPASVSTRPGGWVPLEATLQMVVGHVDRWAPKFTTEAGRVRWPGAELTCDATAWAQRALAVKGLAYRELKVDGNVAFLKDGLKVALTSATAGAGVVLESRGRDVKGDVKLWEQPATLTAKFDDHGWLPAEAVWQAEGWNLPGEKLKLGDVYPAVKGRGKVEWRAQKLSADVAVSAEPAKGKSIPPLDVTVRGQGDLQAFTIEALTATLPGITARLSAPVTVEGSGKFRDSGAHFTVEADLAKQPWFEAKGVVKGEAQLVSTLKQSPVVEFQLSARDIAAQEWTVALAEAKGQFEWPRVTVKEGTLKGTAGETLAWHGGWDIKARELLPSLVEGEIRRATVARWVPANILFERVTVKAEAAGAVAVLKHSGHAQAQGVKVASLNPADVAATWSGGGGALDSLVAAVKMGATSVTTEAALKSGALQFTKLELMQGGQLRLQLSQPATLRWKPALQVEGVHFTGPEGALDAAVLWGEGGRVEATVKNFSSAWLSDLGVLRGPAWRVTSLTAKGQWAKGPMEFSLQGRGELALGETNSAAVAATAHGDAGGVTIDELSVVEGGKSVVKVVGRIPLRLNPTGATKAEFQPEGALALDVTTEAAAGFWQQLKELTGFEIKEPEATAHLTGTWAKPQGTARVKAARLAADPARFTRPMPTVEALDAEFTGDATAMRLERLSVTVEGQTVRAQARLPLGEGKWAEFLKTPAAWARRGVEAKLEIPDAELAALARFLPVFLAPKGKLHVDLTYKGGELGGELNLRDAATRPLGPLGVLQGINAQVAFAGKEIELRSVTAQSGGQTVTLSGGVELPDTFEQTGMASFAEQMHFDVELKGTNLPFVRQTGVLVRGDLDLKLASVQRGSPRITGTVRLRDSLFLSDVRALLPGGVRTKATTPPYFAVEVAPYNGWRLDISLQGERFFKLRTALFTGVASAKFQLSGTLGDPVLRGEAIIDEGAVKLPFATFAVQEGRVMISPEQGIDPQLAFVGTVRRLGYDLRMEATGPATAPTLVFTSSPPLESGQVLLMVMAGESPHDEIAVSDRQRVARLGTFLGQSLVSSLGGESDAGDRLTISTGENVSRQGRETYGFEYKLSDRWSLVAEYDEFDDVNAGVKWRVYSRGGERGETKSKEKEDKKK
jgi:translocation and assembly module TamB